MTKRSPGSPGRICVAALALGTCRVSQSAFTTRISRNWVRKIAQSAETQTRGRPGRQAAVIMMDKVHWQRWVDATVWHRDGDAWRQNADNFCGNKLQKAITKPKHTRTQTHSVLIKYACVCVCGGCGEHSCAPPSVQILRTNCAQFAPGQPGEESGH